MQVILGLWIVSIVGGWFNFLTLVYLSEFLFLHSISWVLAERKERRLCFHHVFLFLFFLGWWTQCLWWCWHYHCCMRCMKIKSIVTRSWQQLNSRNITLFLMIRLFENSLKSLSLMTINSTKLSHQKVLLWSIFFFIHISAILCFWGLEPVFSPSFTLFFSVLTWVLCYWSTRQLLLFFLTFVLIILLL